MKELQKMRYSRVYREGIRDLYGDSVLHPYGGMKEDDDDHDEVKDSQDEMEMEMDFSEAINIPFQTANQSILILGCGNSNLGEQIYTHYNDNQTNYNPTTITPHIIQCDVSSNVIDTMKERYSNIDHIDDIMSIVKADATDPQSFSQFENVNAVVDKGLMDALFCNINATNRHLLPMIMYNVYNSLEVGGGFLFFSFSHPKYLLGNTVVKSDLMIDYERFGCTDANADDATNGETKGSIKGINSNLGMMDTDMDTGNSTRLDLWSDVDVYQLESMYLYKFVKGEEKFVESNGVLEAVRDLPSLHRKRIGLDVG